MNPYESRPGVADSCVHPYDSGVLIAEVLGREGELDCVLAFLDGVPGAASALVLEGEAGIGKTTLWNEAVAEAARRSHVVLCARPVEAEATLPFAGLIDLLDGVSDEVLSGLPAPQRRAVESAILRTEPTGAPGDQIAVSLGFLSILRALSRGNSVVVAVDDLQWLDAPSARVLSYAFRRLAGEPVALVVSRRPGDDPLELKRPPVPGRLVRVIVGPLPVAALDLLLRGRLDLALPPPGLLAVHERTGGSPLYALEVGRALIAGGSLDLGEALPLTATLGGLIEQRIRRLSNEARDLLLMVSALWRPLAAAFPSHGVQLSEAIESGLLVRDGDRLAFGHPIFGSVVYAHASASRRRGVHRLLADMLDDPEERALHLALAADSPDEGVATVLEEAARRAAARGAPDQAAQLAEQACRLTSYEWAGAGVRRRLASAHYHVLAGDGHRAEAILRELIARVPAGRDRAEAFATLANLSRGIPEVIELCRNAIAEAGDDLALRARLELILGWAECLAGEGYPAWERRAAAAVELAEQAADGDMLALALSGLAYSRARLGLGVEPELIERVLRLDPDGDVVVLGESPRAMLGLALAPDAPDEGRALLEEALARAAERGLFTVEWQAARYLATLECQAGNFLAAERHAARAVELARQLDVWNAIPLSLSGAAIVDAYRGRVDACRRHAEETAASARSTGDVLSVIISEHALGLLALSLGDAATAHHHLGPLLEVCSMGFVVSRMCWVLPDEIAALTVLGEVPSAEALLRELEEQADRLDHARMRAIAGRCRALVEAARGELGAALASAERAVAELENLPDPFECARGKLVQGAILRRMRRRGPARTALEEARSIFDEVGAPLWTRRAEKELARLGGRAASPTTLTATEQRVAEMAAAGHTNAEVAAALFLSPKTVEANLSRTFRKLGLRSRRELARALPVHGSE